MDTAELTREALKREIAELERQRRMLSAQYERLKRARAKPGRETLVKRCIERYGRELNHIDRRLEMTRANLEGLGSREQGAGSREIAGLQTVDC